MCNKINEAAITLGRKSEKYGNVLILAGGSGSGKGFVCDMAIDFDGKKVDVDEMKRLMMKFKPGTKIDAEVFDYCGKHIRDMSLKNPEDVATLHMFCKKSGLEDRLVKKFFNDVERCGSERPNLIFDVTLKEHDKIAGIAKECMKAGYERNKIHLVWILNDHEAAARQNELRPRRVPREVLDGSHKGVANNFRNILSKTKPGMEDFNDKSLSTVSKEVEKAVKATNDMMDENEGCVIGGDVWIFFNQAGVDNFVKKSGNKWKDGNGNEHEGMVMNKINAVRVKMAGRAMPDFKTILGMKVKVFDDEGRALPSTELTVADKIGKYIPKQSKIYWKELDPFDKDGDEEDKAD